MSDTPTFDKWWNETGSNEYDVSDHAAVRAGWRACIAHRVVPLEYENAAQRERIDRYISTIHQLWGRLNPELEYVEGVGVAYGADEIDRLSARIAELEAALKGLHDDTADYQRINNIGGYDNHWMKAARAALAKEKP